MTDASASFEDHFWGGGLKGYDVLMQNFKNSINASKELMEFIKERSFVEESYSKSLHRLHKTMSQVPEANLGELLQCTAAVHSWTDTLKLNTFHPVWLVLVEALDGMSKVHNQFSETFDTLHKELSEYHQMQKDRFKKNTKGEIDDARETYLAFEALEHAVNKSRKQYEHCGAEVAALTNDIQTAPPKVKEKLEEKLKKAEMKLKDTCAEHKEAVSQHCKQVMDVQGKMKEAFQKFQSLEEEHVSQMLLFTIKYTSSIDYTHQQSDQAHSTMCAKLNTLPSELLISQFALKKSTGSDKPRPILFKEIIMADLIKAHANEGSQQGEGRLKTLKLFSRRTKRASTDSHHSASASVTSPRDFNLPNSKVPEIDEEGYSIRPVDADRITGFGDNKEAQSSSDSESDDDNRKKFKNLTIKSREHVKTATDDELKSIKLQRPGGPGSSAVKTGSSASLDVLESKSGKDSKDGSLTPNSSKLETSSVDILDLDLSSTKVTPGRKQSAGVDLLGDLPSPVSKALAPSLPFSTSFGSNSSSNTGFNSELGSEILIAGPKTQIDAVGEKKKPAPAPRKKKPTKEVPQPREENSTGNSFTINFGDAHESQDGGKSAEVKKTPRTSADTPGKSLPSSNSNSPVIALPRPPPGGGRRRGRPSDSPLISLKSPTPPPNEPSDIAQDSPGPVKKISPSNSSQTVVPRAVSSNSITSVGSGNVSVNLESQSTSTTQPAPTIIVNPSSSTPEQESKQTSSSEPIPLALAFIETANVIFKGNDLSKAMVKVSGELAVSFPSSCVGQLLIHEEFRFVLMGDLNKLRNVLHNTQFVLKESKDSAEYKFDMEKLFMNLSQKLAENPQATYNNLLALKYEVNVLPSLFPIQFSCRWTKGSTEDKARVDYQYTSEGIQSDVTPPPLQGVILTLPVEGVVGKVATEPLGAWSAEHKKVVWKIPHLSVGQKGSVEATFHHQDDVTLKPSNVQIQFSSDAISMSGLGLKVPSSAYKISLLKKKVLSGRYESEISFE